jgi:hypothetical protein
MAARKGFGTQFLYGDGAGSETFTAVAMVTEIGGVDMSRIAIETTAHDSAGAFEEFIPGIRNGGEISLKLNFDPAAATHDETTGLLSQFVGDEVVRNYRIALPGGLMTFTFPGFITKFNISPALKDKIEGTLSVKVAGAPTIS